MRRTTQQPPPTSTAPAMAAIAAAAEAYARWVRSNGDFVRSLESLANVVTWTLPERFSNSEIAPEAVYAIIGIVSSVNQHIIDTAPTQGLPWLVKKHPFPWPLLVSILKDLEAVVEVAAEYLVGEKRKWNFLVFTEGIKVMARLAAFRESGYKMLLQGGELVNDDKDVLHVSESDHNGVMSNGSAHSCSSNGSSEQHNGHMPSKFEQKAMKALSKFGDQAKMRSNLMGSSMLHKDAENLAAVYSVEKTTLRSLWSGRGLSGRLLLVGELIHIFRPLVYVLLIRKFGIRSWTPWLVSLVVEVSGVGVLLQACSISHRAKSHQLSTSEKDELNRRKRMLALYILRDPFFSKYSRYCLEGAERRTSPVPILGFLTSKLVELLYGAQTRYTYTSGS